MHDTAYVYRSEGTGFSLRFSGSAGRAFTLYALLPALEYCFYCTVLGYLLSNHCCPAASHHPSRLYQTLLENPDQPSFTWSVSLLLIALNISPFTSKYFAEDSRVSFFEADQLWFLNNPRAALRSGCTCTHSFGQQYMRGCTYTHSFLRATVHEGPLHLFFLLFFNFIHHYFILLIICICGH